MDKHQEESQQDNAVALQLAKGGLKSGAFAINKTVSVNAAGLPAAKFASLLGKATGPVISLGFNLVDRQAEGKVGRDLIIAGGTDTANLLYGPAKVVKEITDHAYSPLFDNMSKTYEVAQSNNFMHSGSPSDCGNPTEFLRAMNIAAKAIINTHNAVVDYLMTPKEAQINPPLKSSTTATDNKPIASHLNWQQVRSGVLVMHNLTKMNAWIVSKDVCKL